MNLKSKNNQELIVDIKDLVQKEKHYTHLVLNYLLEIETRRLFLEKGYPSLFAFCTEFLKYSEPESQIRIQAMRLLKTLPQVEEKIKSGEISLTVAAQVQSSIRKEDKRRQEDGLKPLSFFEKNSLVKKVEKASVRESQKILAQEFPESFVQVPDRIKPISDNKAKIEFVASQELVQKLEKLKNLTAHKNFEGSMERLIELIADMALQKLDRNAPQRGAHEVKEEPIQKQSGSKPGVRTSSRYIPAPVRRMVYKRDGGRCQYRDPVTGKVCGSSYGLEVDHIVPWANNGSHDPSNLRLLCSGHNKLEAIKKLGAEKMEKYLVCF